MNPQPLVEYVGSHLDLIGWEKRFLRRLAKTDGDLALSVARGNGKSALCAAIGCAPKVSSSLLT